jgi:hypothetical protein
VTQVTAAAGRRRYQAPMSKSIFRPILADWRRWSRAERLVAILLLAGIVLMQVPLIL